MVTYEAMVLRELGYGGMKPDINADFAAQFETFRTLHRPIRDHLFASQPRDVMAARVALGERLARII